MGSHVGMHDNNKNNNRTTKPIAAAIPMAGILVAAALLSGLVSVTNSYQTAIAQLASSPPLLNITGINATTTTGGEGEGAQSSSACAPTQTGGGGGETTTGGGTVGSGGAGGGGTAGGIITGSGTTTGGAATMGTTNATSTTTAEGGAGGGNQSTTSEVRLHIEEACMALQTGDMQGALMHLDLALNALDSSAQQGNMTTTAGGNTTIGG